MLTKNMGKMGKKSNIQWKDKFEPHQIRSLFGRSMTLRS